MRLVPWLALLALVLGLPGIEAQEIEAERLQLDLALRPGSIMVSRLPQADLPLGANFVFDFADVSIERHVGPGSFAQMHVVDAKLEWEGGEPPGWSFNNPSANPRIISAGTRGSGTFEIFHSPTSTQNIIRGVLNVTLSNPSTGDQISQRAPFSVVVAPSPSASIGLGEYREKIGPDDLVAVDLVITNTDSYAASYRVTAQAFETQGVDPGDVAFGGTGSYFLEPGEQRVVTIYFKAPKQQFWYNAVSMLVQFGIEDANGGARQTVSVPLVVSGFYAPANFYLLILAALAQIALFIFLIVFAKRAYERRYLGRPLPPWRIPEEAANLQRLKLQDPRAHYVLRYFLMEEEYRSALLWFYVYKKISKRKLKAEIRAVELREEADEIVSAPSERFDKSSARIQRRYAGRMERAQLRTQRRIERLQAKLERTYEKDYEKDREVWEKKVEKLQKKHNKPYLKAKAKRDKQVAKILEKWEKPFRKEKKRYEEKLAKAKEAYSKKVKKADKDVWRAWREQMEDWQAENKLRKKEGRELAPEPALLSDKAGPPELPTPFQEPPRPELPPEPQPVPIELPPEPQLAKPELATSHYAKKARKVERKGTKAIRELELDLAEKLNKLHHQREEAGVKVVERREKLIAESQVVTTGSRGFVDRVLRRSEEDIERRHHVAYIRGHTKERIEELEDIEAATLERVRIQGERERADFEAKILVERAEVRRATKTGAMEEAAKRSERIASLVRQLGEAKLRHEQELGAAKKESRQRLDAAIERLKAEEHEMIERELGKGGAAPEAEPSRA